MTAVMLVSETTTTLVAVVPPTVTKVAPVKFAPVMVIWVPPPVGPELGLTAVTVGTGGSIVTPCPGAWKTHTFDAVPEQPLPE